MKMAIACWEDRVAPTFDAARQIHIVESESGKVISEQRVSLHENAPFQNAALLAEQGIRTLVCGAISRGVERMVRGQGIEVIAFVSGGLREIMQAWLAQKPLEDIFAMPGCCGRRRFRGGVPGQGAGQGMWRGVRGVCMGAPFTTEDTGPGRGNGMGMGAGMGRGAGRGTGRGGRGKGGGRGNNF